jgi:hypothetical protein
MIFNFQIIPLDVVSSVTTILAIILLRRRALLDEESADKSWFRENYISLTAGVITYGAYLTAVVFTGEDWVSFLRNHLYDGVAPAALVALLVSRYPSARKIVTDPAPAWPVGYLILLSGAGLSRRRATIEFRVGLPNELPMGCQEAARYCSAMAAVAAERARRRDLQARR